MNRVFVDRPRLSAARLVGAALGFWQSLTDPYRPELYYMRGPGPKWRAKHAAALDTRQVA